MATRSPRGRIESLRHQVKSWLLHSGPEHLGARAYGVSRHESQRSLPHGRKVSLARIHAHRTICYPRANTLAG